LKIRCILEHIAFHAVIFQQRLDRSDARGRRIDRYFFPVHPVPPFLLSAPTERNFVPETAMRFPQNGPAPPGRFVPRPSAPGARPGGIKIRFLRNRILYIGGIGFPPIAIYRRISPYFCSR